MIRALAVLPDVAQEAELTNHVNQIPDLRLVRDSAQFPSMDAILHAIRVDRPDLLFVTVDDLDQLRTFLCSLEDLADSIPVIGLGSRLDTNLTLQLMHLGVREYLTFPLDAAAFDSALVDVREFLRKHPRKARASSLFSFLSAKPGTGCSTIAVAAACTLANELAVPTLLVDGDLHAGSVRFLLKLPAGASLLDALGHADRFDETLLEQMVVRDHNLAILQAGELLPPPTIPVDSLSPLLTTARSLYDVVCVDLPASLDSLSRLHAGIAPHFPGHHRGSGVLAFRQHAPPATSNLRPERSCQPGAQSTPRSLR